VLAALLTVAVVSGIYSVCLFSPTLIVHEKSILRLPVLSHVRNAPHIISRDFLIFSSGQFRPLSYILLAGLRTWVRPENLLFWHLWLLGFHILNTLLVFAIARHFTQRLAVALAAAAVFALHPLSTVIVNNVNQFYMLMGVTLCLGSLKSYLSFARSGGVGLYWASVTLFALALVTARVALSAGLILLVYEFLYQRTHLRRVLLRLSPFVIILLLLLPLFLWYGPHPLYYRYVPMHEGSFWHGLFSVIGATQPYASGLLLTRGIPVVLDETVERIYRWVSPKFLFWVLCDLIIIGAAVVALRRKHWAALGIVIVFAGMIPYATVAYNRVVDYVSWSYLYLPLAGFALFTAGVYDRFLQVQSRRLRAGVQVVWVVILLFFGARSVQLNLYTRSPLAYWSHVCELNPNGQTALYEVGQAYLARDELSYALHFFFAPMVEDLTYPCLTMARHYCRTGDYVASAIHLRFGLTQQNVGVILEDYSEVAGELLAATGALDHAEENFGKILMVDPLNTAAMGKLAQVWFSKGFVHEAYRMLARARGLARNDENLARLEAGFFEKERAWKDSPQQYTVTPLGPDWLRYVLTQARSGNVRQEIVALSKKADPNDAVIQLEATISLLEDQKYGEGARTATEVARCLSGNAYACAVACRAFAYVGDTDRAVPLGIRAVSLDQESKLAWGSLAIAVSRQEKLDAVTEKFIGSLVRHPKAASEFYYNVGLQKAEKGHNKEAVELFRKAVNAEPKNIDAQRALGVTLRDLGEFEEAVTVLEKAVAMKPSDAETRANLGRALLNQGRHAESLTAFNIAVKVDPENAVYHNYLGLALAGLDRRGEAVEEYRRAIELDPQFVSPHYNLANSLAKEGNLSEAVAEYRKVIKILPDHPYAHFNLAAVLYQQGKIDEAILEYQEEVRHNPTFPHAYSRLVIHYCEKGEYDLARSVVKDAGNLGLELDSGALSLLQRVPPSEEK
jgi:tetratricopeptide (TPR) repeat protein